MGNEEQEPATFSDIRGLLADLPSADTRARDAARERNDALTKPAGSLGRLEELAVWYAGWRGEAAPLIEAPQILVFAGNHSVASRGVSAYPSEVTAQMVVNFRSGGAAINQLASSAGAKLDVHPIELDRPTGDISSGPAMSEAEFVDAFGVGWRAVDPASDLMVAGEMGIGNTTSAAAIALALYGGSATDWTGRGTGVEGASLKRKAEIVSQAVDANRTEITDGIGALRCLGGRETAAMAGAIVRARHERIPVVLDGYVCTAAAACLARDNAQALEHAVSGHLSAEAPHRMLLDRLGLEPLLDLRMRLGEASGAAVAVQVLKCALACHSGMATFEAAGVTSV